MGNKVAVVDKGKSDFLFWLELLSFQNQSTDGVYRLPFDKGLTEIFEYLKKENITLRSKKTTLDNIKNLNREFFSEHLQFQDVLIKTNSGLVKTSPLDIKVVRSKAVTASIEYGYVFDDIDNLHKTFFKKIILSTNLTNDTSSFYAHELMHSQIEREQGILKNYFNKEVMSILIEKIFTDIMCPSNMENILNQRMNMLKTAMVRYHKYVYEESGFNTEYETRSYIVSTLIANHLFARYKRASNKNKIAFLKEIQRVIDMEIPVEGFMEEMHVSYKNSKKLKYVR